MPPVDHSEEFLKVFKEYLRVRLGLNPREPKMHDLVMEKFRFLLRDLQGTPGAPFDKLMADMNTMIRSGDPIVPDGSG